LVGFTASTTEAFTVSVSDVVKALVVDAVNATGVRKKAQLTAHLRIKKDHKRIASWWVRVLPLLSNLSSFWIY
jgi:hypothetical protein